ncbi:MAG TPA: hypothetical protein VL738_29655, partial [Dactylosporangium sp.]|nr:hypothetical protein [Dactylosporangium sp.]
MTASPAASTVAPAPPRPPTTANTRPRTAVVTTADSGGDDGGQAHELVDEVVHAVGEAHNLVGADGVGEHGQPIHPMYPADEHHVAALRQSGAGAGGGGSSPMSTS